MNCNNGFKNFFIRSIFLLITTSILSCVNHRFDSDKRQIIAKDEIKNKLYKAHSFDIIAFYEDTVQNATDSNFRKQIRYTLDFVYEDSNNVSQAKKGIVMFTPGGNAIITSQIVDR